MSFARSNVARCETCKREITNKEKLFADTCGHYKCRECILSASTSSCRLCLQRREEDLMQEKYVLKRQPIVQPKKESKISNQTHIKEELSTTGTTQYHCTACGKIFRSRSQKYYHLQCIRANQQLFECNVCQKTFNRETQLKYHLESHSSPINKCSICQKTFTNPLALKKHKALHNVEPQKCPHCDKKFYKKISLEQHIAAQHLHKLQYGCAHCKKRYASKSTLQLHLQSHEKKRFECSFCGKYFQRNSILNLHLKRHNPTNKVKCTLCDKVFNDAASMARHQKIHEEITLQYHCTLCDKSIQRKDNMKRHVNSIHPDEKFENIIYIKEPIAGEKSGELLYKHRSLVNEEEIPEAIEEETAIDLSNDKAQGNVKNEAYKSQKEDKKDHTSILIPDNQIYQKLSNQLPKTNLAFTDDESNISYKDKIRKLDFLEDKPNAVLNSFTQSKAIVTQVQVIIPTLSSDKTNDINFTKILMSNAITHNEEQSELSTSHFSSQKQEDALSCHSLKKSTLEIPIINPEFNKTQNILDAINFSPPTTTVPPKSLVCTQPIAEATTCNKASVIRSIGNVKKIIMPPAAQPPDVSPPSSKLTGNVKKIITPPDIQPAYVSPPSSKLTGNVKKIIIPPAAQPADVSPPSSKLTGNTKKIITPPATQPTDVSPPSSKLTGNVKKIITPPATQSAAVSPASSKLTGNVKKIITPPATQSAAVSPVNSNPATATKSSSSFDYEYKHKKYHNRHFNVDLYRKILGCDEDDDEKDNKNDDLKMEKQESLNENSSSNATPVHWRKSFKNSYETSNL